MYETNEIGKVYSAFNNLNPPHRNPYNELSVKLLNA